MSNYPDNMDYSRVEGAPYKTAEMAAAAHKLESIKAFKEKLLADLKDFADEAGLPHNVQQHRPLAQPYRVFYPLEHLHELMVEAFDDFFSDEIQSIEKEAEGDDPRDVGREWDTYGDGE